MICDLVSANQYIPWRLGCVFARKQTTEGFGAATIGVDWSQKKCSMMIAGGGLREGTSRTALSSNRADPWGKQFD